MHNQPRKHMGIGLIAVAMVFLWNPDIVVFDLLPDFFGYILLCLGLSSLSYLNHHFEESAKCFQRMIAMSGARMVFVLILFGLVNSHDRPTTMLLGNFVFGVLELMTLLPAYKQLFEGFIYAGSRSGTGQSVFAHRSVAPFTAFFVVCKAVLNVLPEFSVLTDGVEGTVSLYGSVWLFRVAGVLIGAVIGLVWLILVLKYLIGIYKDKPYVEYLHTRYMQDIYPNKDLFVAKRYKLGSFFLMLGMMLSLDLPMEGVNVLPDVLCAGCLIAGIMVLRPYLTSWKASVLVSGAYAFISLTEAVWQYRYFKIEEYTAAAALGTGSAADAYVVSIVFSIISAVMFVLTVAGVLNCLKNIIHEHTGYTVAHVDMQTYGKLGALHKKLSRGLVPVLVMTVICALGSVAYTVLLPHSGMGGEWYTVLATLMWLINLVLGAILCVLFVEKNNDIQEQINNRYLLSSPVVHDGQTE